MEVWSALHSGRLTADPHVRCVWDRLHAVGKTNISGLPGIESQSSSLWPVALMTQLYLDLLKSA